MTPRPPIPVLLAFLLAGLSLACSDPTPSATADPPERAPEASEPEAPVVERPGETPVAPGITLGDVREATETIAERAAAAGEPEGASMEICRRLEAAGLVVRCRSMGALGGAIDRATCELAPPGSGLSVIQTWESVDRYEMAMDALTAFEGTLALGNPRTRVMVGGAEGFAEADLPRAREIVEH